VPLARGVGRYFDGFGSLFLGRSRASFEGQAALEWNQAASGEKRKTYPFASDSDVTPAVIDLRPTVRAALVDAASGEAISTIAAAFHNTLAAATRAAVRLAVRRAGPMPVVASGGCFQNRRLAESICAALRPEHDVVLQRTIPPGDGGIALGQAVIAAAIARDGI
jgi:hydrogenase maturation protein HypF